MSVSSEIPNIFEKLDKSTHTQENIESASLETISRLIAVLDHLQSWQKLISKAYKGPLWRRVMRTDGEVVLRFQDFTIANGTTWFWALWIICVVNLRQLRRDYPGLRGQELMIDGKSLESIEVSRSLIRFSDQILRSAEFLTQEKMGICGAASTAFPLQTAIEVLSNARGDTESSSIMPWETIRRIAGKTCSGFLP